MAKRREYEEVRVVIDDNVIDEGDPCEIIDPLFWAITLHEGEDKYLSDLNQFSLPQRYVFAICSYSAEVNNGGHDQFYFNSTGIVWEDALKGLAEIGLAEYHRILNESVDRLGGTPSKDRDVRQAELDRMTPDFDDLDTMYYKLEETIDLDEALMEYIKKNRELFYFDSVVKKPKAAGR